MKKAFAWLGKLLGKVIATVLVIVLLPHAARMADAVIPDLSGAAVNTSVMLSQKLSASARLETNALDVEGVLNSTTNAMFIGTVQDVSIAYRYHASVGVDLSKVGIRLEGRKIVFILPAMEVIADSLTPTTIVRDDFWYPLTDARRQQLLDSEVAACRKKYLEQLNGSEEAWANTIAALESTVAQWLTAANSRLTFEYEHP